MKTVLYKVILTMALGLLGYSLSALYASNRRLRTLPQSVKLTGGDPLTRETVRAGMDAGESLDWSGVRIVHHKLNSRSAQVVYRSLAAKAAAEGWQEEELPEDFNEYGPQSWVMRKEEDFRVFLDMSAGPGAPGYLLELFMDGALARDFDAEHFSLESFLGQNSRGFADLPGPDGGTLFFSLHTSSRSGMVSYLFDEQSDTQVYFAYVRQLESLGWKRAHSVIFDNMIMLVDQNEMCLVGWNEKGINDKPLITVMRHGF